VSGSTSPSSVRRFLVLLDVSDFLVDEWCFSRLSFDDGVDGEFIDASKLLLLLAGVE
jgi:hypothetical protein